MQATILLFKWKKCEIYINNFTRPKIVSRYLSNLVLKTKYMFAQ